jgi:hypothetical protein
VLSGDSRVRAGAYNTRGRVPVGNCRGRESGGCMPGALKPVASVSRAKAVIARDFDNLARRWERETRNLSAVGAITSHPAYQQIIAMGAPAVPLILKRMQGRPAFWFDALRRITGQNPIKPSMRGNVQRMTEAWLQWGTKRGHI